MATVHLGRAVGVGGFERLVAIKVMHQHIASEPEFVTMFLDEARLAARIRHPNVVATIDVQEGADGLFLVMELVDGPSLKHLRKRPGVEDWRLPLGMVVRVMVDVLNGLHAAHELRDDEGEPLQLIHRDVSPANILIGMDGVARITDFGVARAETRLSSTRGGQLKGKVPYMPPEQLMAEPIDRRCDVYATGVVLWEELAGRRLFKAESEGALLQAILTGAQQSPRELVPSVPEGLDRVCMQALSIHPTQRHASAAEMAEALELAAIEAGIVIASSRAVASFLETSGAHQKLDAKALGDLKRASGRGDAQAARGSFPSIGSWPSARTGEGSSPGPPSVPTASSNVTAGAAIVSAQGSGARRSPLRGAIAVGGAIATAGLVGGYVLSRPVVSPSGAASAVPSASPPVVAERDPPTTPSSTVASAVPAAPPISASATPSASASGGRASLSAPAPSPARVAPPRATSGRKTSPRPPSGSYNPEKL